MTEGTENTNSKQLKADKGFKVELYEQKWTIPDWDTIQQSEEGVNSQSFEFQTGRSSVAKTKWKLGFQFVSKPPAGFCLHWKFIESSGFPYGSIKATLSNVILRGDSTIRTYDTEEKILHVGDDFMFPSSVLPFNSSVWREMINPKGEIVFILYLQIMEPDIELKMEMVHKAQIAQICKNFAAFLGDQDTADIKIITSDGVELLAHKIILKAQCPVFEAMFRSDRAENRTGIVNVEDVSGKTMRIILHLMYSRELLPSWKDSDTVVEFTYAVAKYQMTNILNLLDDLIGVRDKEDDNIIDMQLLDLARKLDLKTAEADLMNRIETTMNKMNIETEFVGLEGFTKTENWNFNL